MALPLARIPAALAALILAVPAGAADWQKVATIGGERVDIDKGRIMRTAPGKTVAWTRLVLGRELTDAAGSYSAIQAMNRYDCEGRRFATLKRVYMSGANHERAVRDESVGSPKDIAAAPGSVDEQLLVEACRLRTVGEAKQVAEAAAKAIAEAPAGKPGVMYADVRTADAVPAAHAMPVADAGRPEVKAETVLEPAPARSPGERPRFIELPKIDKSQLEAISPPPAKPGEAKPADGKLAPPAKSPETKAAARPAEKLPPPAAVSRQELERLYATSGPRRPVVAARPRPIEDIRLPPLREVEWAYEGEGAPANWAKLRADYLACATGRRQSPIDIRDGIRVDLEPVRFDYKPSRLRIVDTGHTLAVYVGEGSSMSVMNRTYRLQNFHFHRPSEERINGRTYDMSVHFVHRDDEGRMAEIAVLLEKGAENPLIQSLWNHMPLEVNQDVTPDLVIDPAALLPETRGYYTYMGSLTTPPCTEDVLWIVFKQPLQVSAEQVSIFSRVHKHNARPIQASNGRLIKENR